MRFVGWMDFLKDGWMDFLDGWMDVLMDGWMDVFFGATAQGIWYDQHGNPQVSGLGGGLSGYVPSTEPLPASYVASDRYKENERLKKEIHERIQREREEKNQKRYEDLKKKISERRQAEAEAKANSSEPKAKGSEPSEPKAKGSEPSEPKAKGSEPVSKATSSAPQPNVPNVKQMPNPFMSYEYCAEHSSVTIEEVPQDENQLAIPVPKRHQQYQSFTAAMKRFKKQWVSKWVSKIFIDKFNPVVHIPEKSRDKLLQRLLWSNTVPPWNPFWKAANGSRIEPFFFWHNLNRSCLHGCPHCQTPIKHWYG